MFNKVKQFLGKAFDITYRIINKLWDLFMGFLNYVSHKSVKLGDVCMVAMAIVIMFCGFVVVVVDDEWMRVIAFCDAILQTFAMGILSAGKLRNHREE